MSSNKKTSNKFKSGLKFKVKSQRNRGKNLKKPSSKNRDHFFDDTPDEGGTHGDFDHFQRGENSQSFGGNSKHDREVPIRDNFNSDRSKTSKRSDHGKRKHRSDHPKSEYDKPSFKDPPSQFRDHSNHQRLPRENFQPRENPVSNFRVPVISDLQREIAFLNEQLFVLKQENEELNFRVFNAPHHNTASDISIFIQNEALREKLLPALEDLVQDLVSERISVDELQDFTLSRRNKESLETYKKLPKDELFSLDNSTAEDNENSSVPKYFTVEDGKSDKVPCKFCSEVQCAGECAKQKKFKPKVSSSRYHVFGENQANFKPGILSKELRAAMDLKPDRIPLFTYHMRILGYPPGWLEEATVESSGITLYGTDGEVENSSQQVKNHMPAYNPDALIDFPGFNCPTTAREECDRLGYPPMMPHQQKEYAIRNMPKADMCPKRKRQSDNIDSPKPTKEARTAEDMDVEELTSSGDIEMLAPPLPEDDPLPPLPPPEPSVEDALPPTQDSEFGVESETLTISQLKDLKKQLIAELTGVESSGSQDEDGSGSSPSSMSSRMRQRMAAYRGQYVAFDTGSMNTKRQGTGSSTSRIGPKRQNTDSSTSSMDAKRQGTGSGTSRIDTKRQNTDSSTSSMDVKSLTGASSRDTKRHATGLSTSRIDTRSQAAASSTGRIDTKSQNTASSSSRIDTKSQASVSSPNSMDIKSQTVSSTSSMDTKRQATASSTSRINTVSPNIAIVECESQEYVVVEEDEGLESGKTISDSPASRDLKLRRASQKIISKKIFRSKKCLTIAKSKSKRRTFLSIFKSARFGKSKRVAEARKSHEVPSKTKNEAQDNQNNSRNTSPGLPCQDLPEISQSLPEIGSKSMTLSKISQSAPETGSKIMTSSSNLGHDPILGQDLPEISQSLPEIGSKSMTLGTPSLSRHSSFSKLPDYGNFSKHVTEHMNFENLPNSTGTYKRMKAILSKVKDKINAML